MVFGFNAANLAFISEIKPSTLIKNSKTYEHFDY